MKMILSSIVLILSVFSFTGCCKKDIQIVTKYKLVKPIIPNIKEKPLPREYSTIMVKFNGVDYFAIERAEAAIMSSNWEMYKSWAETNYQILLDVKELDDTNVSK